MLTRNNIANGNGPSESRSFFNGLAVSAVIAILALAAWITYWNLYFRPEMIDKAREKCLAYISRATESQCQCIAESVVDRLGKYFNLDQLIQRKRGIDADEMKGIRRSCGILDA